MAGTRNNYQLQADDRTAHMTVGELLESLKGLPASMPVVLLSPQYGAFGSEMPYAIAAVEETVMPRMEHTEPASEYEDEETGKMVRNEEYTQVWPEWRGVILQGRSD